MKFFEMLANFFGSPIDSVTQWLDNVHGAFSEWVGALFKSIGIGITSFIVEGIAVVVIVYSMYCACRIMMTSKNETFSEYLNKSLIAALGYFFAKYGGLLILNAIGG